MTAPFAFMGRVMQEGRALSKDYFMWHECFGSDLPGMGYSTHTGNDRFASELSAAGRKRLVCRSSSTYNLYGGMPTVKPSQDCTFRSPVTVAAYRGMVADPMNRWLVRFVREHGCRVARFGDHGVAWCAGHLVVDPGKGERRLLLPTDPGVRSLRNVVSGATATVGPDGSVVLPADSAWEAL